MRAGDWSWTGDPDTAPPDVLDVRSRTPLPGSTPVVEGEHVVPVRVELPDLDATRALGRRLAAALRPGDLLLLDGPLGAGKTSLTQGLGEALGVRGRVTSPTFVLAREHRGPLPMVHVDAYRLRDAGAAPLDDLDLEGSLEVGVVVVEWGAGLVEHVSGSRLHVVLDRAQQEGRTAQVRPVGPRWAVLGNSRGSLLGHGPATGRGPLS